MRDMTKDLNVDDILEKLLTAGDTPGKQVAVLGINWCLVTKSFYYSCKSPWKSCDLAIKTLSE